MTTAYGLYDESGRWLAWVPCGSVPDARSIARQAVRNGQAARYVIYNRDGLAVEEGPEEEANTADEAAAGPAFKVRREGT